MASSNRKEIADAILAAINEDGDELREELLELPEKVAHTVRWLTPVGQAPADDHAGQTLESIEVKSRKSALKKLSTRKVKLGQVYSDDDPERVASIEYGRGADAEHGATPEFAMFRRAAAIWNDADLD